MPKTIQRGELQRLLNNGAKLVEVLPSSAHKKAHLPGAINIPLAALDKAAAEQLDRHAPVIVYCHDYL